MRTAPANLVSTRVKELRIARWDESLTPYSQEEFIVYYGPESGWNIWQDAVAYRDDAGNIRHVLVRMGDETGKNCVEVVSRDRRCRLCRHYHYRRRHCRRRHFSDCSSKLKSSGSQPPGQREHAWGKEPSSAML